MLPGAMLRAGFMTGAAAGGGGVLPTYTDKGAIAAGTASINVSWPSHAIDDIGILIVKTANEALPGNPSGCLPIFTPTGIGVATAAGSARLHAYWIRATSGAMAAIATGDSGTMQTAYILGFRGCKTTGDPVEATATNTQATSTALSIPGLTTLGANRLIVALCAIGDPDGSINTNASGWANADLASITEMVDQTVTSSVGGGFVGAYGGKVAAGTVGNTTATLATAANQERLCFSLIPA